MAERTTTETFQLTITNDAILPTKHAVHYSSKNESWNTPHNILGLARRFANGQIYLDPCTNPTSAVNAVLAWDMAIDGLKHPWPAASVGCTWVNPPYGPKLKRWSKKIATEAHRGAEILTLLPARTETEWWHETLIPATDAFCFYRRRVTFLGGKASAPFPSVTTYHGPRPHRFVQIFSELGWCFVNPHRPKQNQLSLF